MLQLSAQMAPTVADVASNVAIVYAVKSSPQFTRAVVKHSVAVSKALWENVTMSTHIINVLNQNNSQISDNIGLFWGETEE